MYSLDRMSSVSRQSENDTLALGVIAYTDSAKIHKAFWPFTKYIAGKLGKTPKIFVVDYQKLTSYLESGLIDIGVYSPLAYLDASKQNVDIRAFASHLAYGRAEYTSVILTKRSSGIHKLEELRNKRFKFVSRKSGSGYHVPIGFFRQMGIAEDSLKSFFANGFAESSLFSGSHKRSLELLLMDSVDAIATYYEAHHNDPNFDLSNIEILESAKVPYNAYVFSKTVNLTDRSRIKEIMLNAHLQQYDASFDLFYDELKHGGEKWDKLGIERWSDISDDHYNDLRFLIGFDRHKPMIKLEFAFDGATGGLEVDMRDRLIREVKLTNRFEFSGDKSIAHLVTLRLHKHREILDVSLSVGHNGISRAMSNEYYEDDQWVTQVVSNLLNKTVFNQGMYVRSDNNGPYLEFGRALGFNNENYHYISSMQDSLDLNILENRSYILNNNFSLSEPIKVNAIYSDKSTKSKQIAGNKWWNELDYLDLIVGVFGIFVTGYIGYFQRLRERRFKKMRDKANDLLKLYLEGEKIDKKILSLKALIGGLLEKRYIRETHFNLLNQKMKEISKINQKRYSIPEDLREKFDEILKDGHVSEIEYSQILEMIGNFND